MIELQCRWPGERDTVERPSERDRVETLLKDIRSIFFCIRVGSRMFSTVGRYEWCVITQEEKWTGVVLAYLGPETVLLLKILAKKKKIGKRSK